MEELPLNEGREVNPDDTEPARSPKAEPTALNEGREVNPDDTCRRVAGGTGHGGSLNEGREVNPDDTRRWPTRSPLGTPLNEGREVNPDDTRSASARRRIALGAQRRSGG